MILKLDLQKSFDRLEWTFVMEALKIWGFVKDVRKMIFSCIGTVDYTMLVNGNQVGSLDLEKGLRQRDPLSPYLFIICDEVLSRMIDREQAIKGIKICSRAPPISHILFADDILLMYKANFTNATAIANFVEQLWARQGQLVNKEKSHVLFSKNTNVRIQKEIKCTLSLKDLKDGALYLENNLIIGRNGAKEFKKLKERIQSQFAGMLVMV